MKILQNDYILKSLELPTMEWKQYFPDTEFAQNILWSIKVEEIPSSKSKEETLPKKKINFLPFGNMLRDKEKERQHGLIGVDAKTAKGFANRHYKSISPTKQAMIYYPYYMVGKSGILDINSSRIVIEGTKGDISNLVKHNQIEVMMMFTKEDMNIHGDDHFFSKEQVLSLIDTARKVKRMTAEDLEFGKNIQLHFSYVYKTSTALQPEGELQLIFYQFKLF